MSDPPDLWRREYEQRGIPSSTREEPSGSVVDFVSFLASRGAIGGTAADLGCGAGRNSLFLVRSGFDLVHSFDLVAANIASIAERVSALGLVGRVRPLCRSVAGPWPIEDDALDAAIDTFCYKHLISQGDRAAYRRELVRTLRPGGFYLLTLADIDDGYYGPQLATSPSPDERVIVDPANGIPSVLFSKDDVLSEFSSFFLDYYAHARKEGPMHGGQYLRSTHIFIFSRS